MAFDLGKELLLERQIFGDRLDHVADVAQAVREISGWPHTFDGARIVAEIAQIGGDARLDGLPARLDRVVDRDLMAGEREHLRDAVTHQAGADDRDARLLRHDQPAV